MKVSYNRKDDVLMYEVRGGHIDHAEQMGPIIVHFDRRGKPVLLEILDASDFLARSTEAAMNAKEGISLEI